MIEIAMQQPAKKTEFQSQRVVEKWPAVRMTERAKERSDDLSILYPRFNASLNRALLNLLEAGKWRLDKIDVVELMPEEGMPSGIKLSFRYTGDALVVCDFWTPLQPKLFG